MASGELNLEAGFVQSTIIHKMRKANEAWIRDELRVEPESVFADNRATELALRGCGLHLFPSGLPRYLLIYSITAIQNEFPSFRNHLTGAWQIDKKWQLVEPGQCRSILPACGCQGVLDARRLVGMEALAGTRHPRVPCYAADEMLGLRRRDLVFPGDGFGHVKALRPRKRPKNCQVCTAPTRAG